MELKAIFIRSWGGSVILHIGIGLQFVYLIIDTL